MSNAYNFIVRNFDIEEVEEYIMESITKFVTPEWNNEPF